MSRRLRQTAGTVCCPSGCGDMPQPRRHRYQGALPIGEGADNPRSSSNLPHQPLQRVVGPQAAPVFGGMPLAAGTDCGSIVRRWTSISARTHAGSSFRWSRPFFFCGIYGCDAPSQDLVLHELGGIYSRIASGSAYLNTTESLLYFARFSSNQQGRRIKNRQLWRSLSIQVRGPARTFPLTHRDLHHSR